MFPLWSGHPKANPVRKAAEIVVTRAVV